MAGERRELFVLDHALGTGVGQEEFGTQKTPFRGLISGVSSWEGVPAEDLHGLVLGFLLLKQLCPQCGVSWAQGMGSAQQAQCSGVQNHPALQLPLWKRQAEPARLLLLGAALTQLLGGNNCTDGDLPSDCV